MMIRKKHLLSLLIFCLPFTSGAQNRWFWDNGPLDWWMFRQKDTTETIPTSIKIDWDTTRSSVRQGRTVILVNKIEAFLDMDSSWVRATTLPKEILESHQRSFDRAHLLAEKNWRAAFMGDLPLETALDACRLQYEAGEWPEETGDDFRQIKWKPEGMQVFSALSYVYLVPTGSLAQITGPTQGLSLESGLLFGKRMVSAELAVGRGDYLNPYISMNGASADKASVPYLGAFLKYSRTLMETGDIRLALFGGGGYSRRMLLRDHTPFALGGASLSEGLAGEWNCLTRIHARRKPYRRSGYVLRVRLYSDQIWYQTPRFFSPTFNISIGIGNQCGKVRPTQ